MPEISQTLLHDNPNMLLREARHRAGLTQAGLARRIGVVQQTVYQYEMGMRVPAYEVLVKMLVNLGCDGDPAALGYLTIPKFKVKRLPRAAPVAIGPKVGGPGRDGDE